MGNVEWLASFCPMGQNELQGITPGKSNFLELDEEDFAGIGEGLSQILRFYKEELRLSSFNFIIYSGSLGRKREDFWCSVRIVSRPNFSAGYINDTHLAPIFYLEDWYPYLPEALAASFKRYSDSLKL